MTKKFYNAKEKARHRAFGRSQRQKQNAKLSQFLQLGKSPIPPGESSDIPSPPEPSPVTENICDIQSAPIIETIKNIYPGRTEVFRYYFMRQYIKGTTKFNRAESAFCVLRLIFTDAREILHYSKNNWREYDTPFEDPIQATDYSTVRATQPKITARPDVLEKDGKFLVIPKPQKQYTGYSQKTLDQPEISWLQKKRNLVTKTAHDLNTTTQKVVMAYKDLIGRHLYDDNLSYIVEQMQFIDIDNITPRPQPKSFYTVPCPWRRTITPIEYHLPALAVQKHDDYVREEIRIRDLTNRHPDEKQNLNPWPLTPVRPTNLK